MRRGTRARAKTGVAGQAIVFAMTRRAARQRPTGCLGVQVRTWTRAGPAARMYTVANHNATVTHVIHKRA